jgi:hypothetical protein
MKNAVFWDVAPCKSCVNRRFGRMYRLHPLLGWWFSLQPPAHDGSSLADFSTLKMEVICSSATSVYTRSTRRHIPEDGILHTHRRENLKSYTTYAVPQPHLRDDSVIYSYECKCSVNPITSSNPVYSHTHHTTIRLCASWFAWLSTVHIVQCGILG